MVLFYGIKMQGTLHYDGVSSINNGAILQPFIKAYSTDTYAYGPTFINQIVNTEISADSGMMRPTMHGFSVGDKVRFGIRGMKIGSATYTSKFVGSCYQGVLGKRYIEI